MIADRSLHVSRNRGALRGIAAIAVTLTVTLFAIGSAFAQSTPAAPSAEVSQQAAPQPPIATPGAPAADQPAAAAATPTAPDSPTAAPAPSSAFVPGALPRDLSPWGMFINADIVVKLIMIGLAFASLVTWTVWLAKSIELAAAKRKARAGVPVSYTHLTLPTNREV